MTHRMLLAAVLAAATTVAFAGSQEGMKEQGHTAYKALDANGDGMISPEEATANPNVAAQFDQLDANGDSRLDQGEFARFEAGAKSE
ncbi:EF-hand domain-containing protein [Ectothiorhodospiraceae bacterium WFHF3C12]|nr:EF-hand domain-containing protein [Ectothiorhodospiraceae bacterium WFHF3C12]